MILRCNTKLIKWLLINLLGLLSLFANASTTVDLVTGERVPYIGNYLYNKGYVYQLVEEAFARSGYNVKISFHPWARAKDYVLKT
ncbi:hypothetical protein KCG35_20340, partial [Zooshikella sp. WH53]|nr:hypothetical protein [Zooshikella harenae]